MDKFDPFNNIVTLGGCEPDELKRYLQSDLPINNNSFALTTWWRSHESDYPTMAKMARDHLAIQASSVASERVFSTSSNLVSSSRTCLDPKTVRAAQCLKNWIRTTVIGNLLSNFIFILFRKNED